MTFLLTLLGHVVLLFALGTLVQFAYLSALRVRVERVTVFQGLTPLKFHVGGTLVSVGWIPTGISLSYDQEAYRRKPWIVRVVGILSGAILAVTAAAVLLGFPEAARHTLAGLWQIPTVWLMSGDTMAGFFARWWEVAEASPVRAFGLLAAKFAALQLTPLGGWAVTMVLAEIAAAKGRKGLERLAVWNAALGMGTAYVWIGAALWLAVGW